MIAESLARFAYLLRQMSDSRMAVGTAGEMLLEEYLKSAGYRVRRNHRRGDLQVFLPTGGHLFIEVKTARKCKDGKWRFTLLKTGCTDHRKADVVALLCVMRTGQVVPFIIPVAELMNQRQAVITSSPGKYAGKLAKYRQSIKALRL